MGYTEFLVGQHSPSPSNLPKAIANLEDASTVFMARWANRDLQRAGAVSEDAMVLLDFIVNELLRVLVDRKGNNSYEGTPFASEMAHSCALGVTGASSSEHSGLMEVGPGNASLPTHLGPPQALNLQRLLNKVKHRNPDIMNFRVENGRHIFVVGADHTHGGAEGIYEFDVLEFCKRCQDAVSAI